MIYRCIEKFKAIKCCRCNIGIAAWANESNESNESTNKLNLICGWCIEEIEKTLIFMNIITNKEIENNRLSNQYLTVRIKQWQNVHDNMVLYRLNKK